MSDRINDRIIAKLEAKLISQYFSIAKCCECGEILFDFDEYREHEKKHSLFKITQRVRRKECDCTITNIDYAAAYEEMTFIYDARACKVKKIIAHYITFCPCGNYAYITNVPRSISLI